LKNCKKFRRRQCFLNLPKNAIGKLNQFSVSCLLPQPLWIFYKGFFMCFFWALWLYDGTYYEKGYWMVYLTLWTLLTTCLYFTCTFILAIWYKLEADHDSMSSLKKFFAYFTWVLYSIQVSLPLLITIVFLGSNIWT